MYICTTNKIKRLIEKGADVNTKGEYGSTLLHYAALRNNIEIAKLLIASGADVGAKRWDGETPLRWANWVKSNEVATLLREHGAE